jgi:uncharacterized membrane protein
MASNETSFNKAAGGGHTRLHVLNALLFVAMWGVTLYLYGQLPERIPGHIGPGGVTRWEARESGMWFMLPILGSGQLLLMYVLSVAVTGSAHSMNIPQKKRLLALPRAGQQYALQPVRGFMLALAAWLLALTTYIQFTLYRVAVAAQTAEPATGHLLLGVVVFSLVPLYMAFRLSRAVRLRIEEWEAGEAD